MSILSKKTSYITLMFTMMIVISIGLIFSTPLTAKATLPDVVYNNGDTWIGTDGNVMSAANAKQWKYGVSEDGKSIELKRYTGPFPGGQINGFVPKMINGLPVTTMEYCFYQCEGLVVAPVIPDTVYLMHYTFMFCTKLTQAPVIPTSVTNLNYTFGMCYSLVNAPQIPDSVTRMDDTFNNCKKLTIAPIIPPKVICMSATFASCASLKDKPVIPSSVEYLSLTFWGCDNIK